MGTGSGASAVLNEKVNAAFRAMLNEWARFLASPDSTYVLNSDPVSGWFGRAAKTAMPYFATNLICEPTAPHYEFTSWDDFFTRRFRPGVCPFDAPDDDAVIVNACESAPYRLAPACNCATVSGSRRSPTRSTTCLRTMHMSNSLWGAASTRHFLDALSYHR
nr:phophatidylserine decarboxylase associated domain-containing protein [Xanthomonas vasicola]MDO6937515.1 phophatidylserine decarboxylase associated domain-containing protein [Xanthomonas vasicola]